MTSSVEPTSPSAASSPRRWRLPRFSPTTMKLLRAGAALAVLGLCAWAASRLDLRGAARALADAHVGWLLVACAGNFALAFLQSVRWKVFLRTSKPISVLRLNRYLLASRAASNLLPARAGELLRIYLPARRDGLPPVTLGSILVVERIFDALGLAAVAAPLLLVPGMAVWVRGGILVLVGGGLAGLIAVFLLARRGSREQQSFLDRVAQSVEPLRAGRAMLTVLGLTLLEWYVEVGMVAACLLAVRLPASFSASLLVLLAVNLGLVFQVTPANVGLSEATAVAALAVLGIDGPRALAMAVLYHLVQIVPVTLAGLEGLRLLGEAKAAKAESDAAQAAAAKAATVAPAPAAIGGGADEVAGVNASPERGRAPRSIQ